jgi:hypothetical protein
VEDQWWAEHPGATWKDWEAWRIEQRRKRHAEQAILDALDPDA